MLIIHDIAVLHLLDRSFRLSVSTAAGVRYLRMLYGRRVDCHIREIIRRLRGAVSVHAVVETVADLSHTALVDPRDTPRHRLPQYRVRGHEMAAPY